MAHILKLAHFWVFDFKGHTTTEVSVGQVKRDCSTLSTQKANWKFRMFKIHLNITKFVSWLKKNQENIKNQHFSVTKIMKLQWNTVKNRRGICDIFRGPHKWGCTRWKKSAYLAYHATHLPRPAFFEALEYNSKAFYVFFSALIRLQKGCVYIWEETWLN